MLLLVLALLQATGRTTPAQEAIAPRLRVEIVFDGTPMPPKLEASAMMEARLIWARYGVDVHASNASDAPLDSTAIRLAVTLVDHEALRAVPDTLGSIQFDDGVPEPAIAMFPNAIAALVSTVELYGRSERAWPTALHNLIVGRALGRALAHEIGHFLLRTRYHSPTGLMRALQPVTDLVAADRRCFTLSRNELTRLASSTLAAVQSAASSSKGN